MRSQLILVFFLSIVLHSLPLHAGQCLREIKVDVPVLPHKFPDPVYAKSMVDAFVYRQVLENLVAISGDGHLTSAIAKSWRISRDGLTYDFFLDPEARFSDGSVVTAKDVAISLNRPFWVNDSGKNRGVLAKFIAGSEDLKPGSIASGTAVMSGNHLRIVLKKPYPPLLKILAYSLYGVVKLDSKYENVIATTGPMTVHKVAPDGILLKRNPSFRGFVECVPDRVELKKINDPELISKRLLIDKSADFALGYERIPGVPSSDMIPVSIGYGHLFLNKNRVDFQDATFRHDFVEIFQNALHENFITGDSTRKWLLFMPPTVMVPEYYKREIKPALSPLQFRDRWCDLKCNQPFSIVLSEMQRTRLLEKNFRTFLSKAGLKNLRISYLPFEEWYRALKEGNFDLIDFAYMGTYSDPDSYLNPLIGDNSIKSILSGNLADEIEKIRYTPSEAARRLLYSQVIEKFESDRYFVPLEYIPMRLYKRVGIEIPFASFKYDLRLDVQKTDF